MDRGAGFTCGGVEGGLCGVGFAPSSIVGARLGTGPLGVNFRVVKGELLGSEERRVSRR